MANELVLPPGNASGLTVTAKVFTQAGTQVGSDLSCSEVGNTSTYRGNMPTATQGVYLVRFDSSAGDFLGTYEMNWDGSAERTVFDNATASAITGLNNLSVSDVTGAVPTVSAIQNGLATEANLNAVKAKTDGLNFIGTDVKSTLNGELVTTDTASRNASKADVSSLATTSHVQEIEDKVDTLDTVADAIKNKTDGLNFTGTDVKATLDNEEVTTDAASRNASKADVSNLARQSDVLGIATASHLQEVEDKVDAVDTIVDAIKPQTDKLTFSGTDVKATLDNETVTTDVASRNASKADVSGLATAAALASVESAIRGADSRDLTQVYDASGTTGISALQATADAIKLVTDKFNFNSANDVYSTLDSEVVTTDTASRNASKADVSLLPTINAAIGALNNLSGNDVLSQVTSALGDYDAPTKTEMDTFETAITELINGLNNLGAAQVNAEVDAALANYDGPTKTEMDAAFNALSNTTANEVVTAMSAMVIEGSLTFIEYLRAIGAGIAGDGSVSVDGGTVTYQNITGAKAVLTATVDAAGNRTITKDLT